MHHERRAVFVDSDRVGANAALATLFRAIDAPHASILLTSSTTPKHTMICAFQHARLFACYDDAACFYAIYVTAARSTFTATICFSDDAHDAPADGVTMSCAMIR